MNKVIAITPPNNSKKIWIVTGALAALLLFMSVTQLISLGAFTDIVAEYDLLPARLLVFMIIALQLLAIPALLPLKLSPALRTISAYSVLLLPILWSVMAVQAYARGLIIENCGCYGIYFAQKLGLGVLLQDLVFTTWGIYSFLKIKL